MDANVTNPKARTVVLKIAIACDHGAYHFKAELLAFLERMGHEVQDFGTHSLDSCDYPDFGVPAVKSVVEGKNDRVILSCTNGIGIYC